MSLNKVKELYIHSKHRLKFVNNYSLALLRKLQDEETVILDRLALNDSAQEMILDMVRNIQLSEEVVELAEASIKLLAKVVESDLELSDLLGNMLQNKFSFRYCHCQLTTYIAYHVIRNMEWGNTEQFEKLSYVAFFHDVALDTDRLTRVNSDKEMQKLNLSEFEKDKVFNHAIEGSKLVGELKKVPMGAATLIKQHHGVKNGFGFKDVTQNISHLAIVFIVCEGWASMLIESKEKGIILSKEEMLEALTKKYPGKTFKKTIDVLEGLEFS